MRVVNWSKTSKKDQEYLLKKWEHFGELQVGIENGDIVIIDPESIEDDSQESGNQNLVF